MSASRPASPEPAASEPAASPAAPKSAGSAGRHDDEHVPVVRISPLLVFGLPPFWCIATCPTCDAGGFIQEDVHPMPLAPTSRCAYGHVYKLELESDLPLDASFLDDEF